MSPVLQVGDQRLNAAEVLPLLAEYQMLPLLVKEMVIDQAIAQIECTSQDKKLACEQLAQQYQLTSETLHHRWLQQHGLSLQQFEAIAVRQFKLEKFKQMTWGVDLESYFLQRKPQLNKVVYSLISTKDIGIAQEIYFRIQEGEQSFAQLAREYAQGPEAETDGLVGPVELQALHPSLARILAAIQPQQLLPPTPLGDWLVVIRLEKLLPAQLDRQLRQRLLNERFHSWIQQEMATQKWQLISSEAELGVGENRYIPVQE